MREPVLGDPALDDDIRFRMGSVLLNNACFLHTKLVPVGLCPDAIDFDALENIKEK